MIVFVKKAGDRIPVEVTGADDPKIATLIGEHGAENVEVEGMKVLSNGLVDAPVAPAKRVRKPKAPAKAAPKKKAKR